MEEQLLECGHYQPAKLGAGATWCPICNQIALVVEAPEQMQRADVIALAAAHR